MKSSDAFDHEFYVPLEWVVAEIARDDDGRVTVEAPGVPLDQAFRAAVEEYVTELARSVPGRERIEDVLRLVVTPKGDCIHVQMLDVGFELSLHPQAFGLRPVSNDRAADE